MAELKVVGVPLMIQFDVLKLKPVFVCRFGEILQEVAVPVIVTILGDIDIFCVKVNGDPE